MTVATLLTHLFADLLFADTPGFMYMLYIFRLLVCMAARQGPTP